MKISRNWVYSGIIMTLIMLVVAFSCGQGSGSTPENVQEKEEAEKNIVAENPQNVGTESNSPYEVNRSVDLSSLPTVVDLLSSEKTISEIKLSDFGKNVTYIILENPMDSALLWDSGIAKDEISLDFGFDGKYIVVKSVLGMSLFDMNGKFLEPIGKYTQGITFYNGGVMYRSDEFIGIGPFYYEDGCLLYILVNGPEKVLSIKRFFPSADDGTIRRLNTEGLSGAEMFLGDTLITIKPDRWIAENFDIIAITGTNSWAGTYSPFIGGEKGIFMEIFDYNGDTLCLFPDYDRIGEWKYGNSRNAVYNESYIYEKMFTVKPAYNDTVFRVIPPNRLLPVYIVKFGDQKLKKEEGLRPDIDLSETYINYSLIETGDNLFIKYTQNYDCPTNRRDNTVWFHNVLYNKSNGTIVQDSVTGNIPAGVINDIDGGVPFWPQRVGADGEMAQIISGKTIKERVSSVDFRDEWTQSEQGKRLIALASGLNEKDVIIMVVE